MKSYSIHYSFSQRFDVPAKAAFDWCVDYRADDWERMGKRGTRKIRHINEDTLVLTDTYSGEEGPVTKKRLVRLNPELLAWTGVHISGPNRHSQFWYRIVEEEKGRSRLDFTGLQVNYGKRPSDVRIAEMAKELMVDDSKMWILLAKEMRRDLARQQP
jgi:hypothetical protein